MSNDHDVLFKAIFSEPRNAREHFERFLPPAVVATLDLDQLRRVPGSFVTKHSKERHTDLLFEAPSTTGGASAGPYRNRPTPGDAVMLAAVIEHAPRLGIDPTSHASACLAGTKPLDRPTTDTR